MFAEFDEKASIASFKLVMYLAGTPRLVRNEAVLLIDRSCFARMRSIGSRACGLSSCEGSLAFESFSGALLTPPVRILFSSGLELVKQTVKSLAHSETDLNEKRRLRRVAFQNLTRIGEIDLEVVNYFTTASAVWSAPWRKKPIKNAKRTSDSIRASERIKGPVNLPAAAGLRAIPSSAVEAAFD